MCSLKVSKQRKDGINQLDATNIRAIQRMVPYIKVHVHVHVHVQADLTPDDCDVIRTYAGVLRGRSSRIRDIQLIIQSSSISVISAVYCY